MTVAPAAAQTATSFGLDGALAHRRVAVPRRAELVSGVVAVHEIDPAGDGRDPVDYAEQVLSCGERVAGVQAEADVVVTDRVP
jgi:hypothetical protein